MPRSNKWSDAEENEIRNRFKYHVPTPEQKEELEQGAELVNELVEFLISLGKNRDTALALTHLEDFRMKMNKAIVIGSN